MPRRKIYVERRVRNWLELEQLQEFFAKNKIPWVFRGQSDATWGLVTTLERSVAQLTTSRDLSRLEGGLLRRFKRQAHHYIQDSPPDQSWLEWLALMQHHGAPTRLLDWTYSFFVGLYFAIENSQGPSALWALDTNWIGKRVKALVPPGAWKKVEKDPNLERPQTFVALFARPKADRIRLVCPVNPYRLNQRLAIQQGTFLCPGDVAAGFEPNLTALFPGGRPNGRLIKCVITLDRKNREDVMRRLLRMNVTSTSLFPGLDGFSRSLSWFLTLPRILRPDPSWPSR